MTDQVAEELGHRNTYAVERRDDGRVLALDLATVVGWANVMGPCGESLVTSGAKSFAEARGESRGDRLWRFEQWLAGFLAAGPLDLVAYELQQGGQRAGFHAADAYAQFVGVLLLFCAKRSIPTKTVHAMTLKKAVAGTGRAKKPDMMAAVRALGFEFGDDNEADALAVLHWATGVRRVTQ